MSVLAGLFTGQHIVTHNLQDGTRVRILGGVQPCADDGCKTTPSKTHTRRGREKNMGVRGDDMRQKRGK